MAPLDLIAQVKQRIAHLTSPELALSDLSLTNCDREPIHIPSAIQSHGVLLTFSEADLTILQISQNSAELLGRPPDAFLGQPLAVLLLPSDIEAVQNCLQAEFDTVNPLRLLLSVDGRPNQASRRSAENLVLPSLELRPSGAIQPGVSFECRPVLDFARRRLSLTGKLCYRKYRYTNSNKPCLDNTGST